MENIDLDSMFNSGSAALSETRNTAKEVGQDYYNDQIRPTVDTALDTTKQVFAFSGSLLSFKISGWNAQISQSSFPL
ncbi:hypothetical protein FACS189428_5450 [Clostridia bacterium]|nr:hypothetical protein FACS189428_5450 [Clostridia bacterium]